MNPFILADADRCIGCRTCEIACAVAHAGDNAAVLSTRHFFPRLRIVKTTQVSVPIICRQCENAPCANVCPSGAIVRSRSGMQVIQALCIGCKSCAVACPFGAIEVVTMPPLTALDREDTHNSEAHKCDLCTDRAKGPACIEVCPTHALQLISPATLQQQIAQKQRETACNNADIHLF
ncbi:effector protein [Chania multitudinisentens RB-25]|uniref:Effector protein n=1 Tax=Chania multitudinisentens RB-25 TaxID=1441930 RepID=W0L656_9GAMM|nr:4Fe-4S binding protein [Chania multitudinisentens]AHG19293.1 effector protein [Chania multitudinisentens RB-25]